MMNLFGLGKNDESSNKSDNQSNHEQNNHELNNASSHSSQSDNRKNRNENSNEQDNDSSQNSGGEGTLQLHAEQLNVDKSKVQSGEVTLSKDIVEEQKSIDVPVTHEEIVIERKSFDNKQSDSSIGSGETIRIPVSEERVNVQKNTVITEEISAHKRQVEETKHIEETVKREEAHIEATGDTKVTTE